MNLPTIKPQCPYFGSGPTRKRPGWDIEDLNQALLGRSHRSIQGKEKLRQIIELTRTVLEIPADYRIAIMPGSATGAIESSLWSLLGARPVDVMAFDVFGHLWVIDILEQLRLPDARSLTAEFGHIPDLNAYNPAHDLVFTWNGTTSGVCIPHADWIPDNREGLTICDATSAAFCFDLPWKKLDVVAYSWQKGLGGEAAHGMLILSPKAVERLETHQPAWPIPRLFRLTKNGKLIEGLFRGETINTPSMLCVEDCLDALLWAESIGGLQALIHRTQENFHTLKNWVGKTPWIDFMAANEEIISPVSVCLTLPDLKEWEEINQRNFLQTLGTLLRHQGAAFDIVNHAFAPPSLRVWCGPTVEKTDIEALLPWLEWGYHEVLKDAAHNE